MIKISYNKTEYRQNLRRPKAELLELVERIAKRARIKVKRKAIKADLAAFLALFDQSKTFRDPNSKPGPQDPDCKCAICEALRKRNAVPFEVYDDDWSPDFKRFLENL